MSPRIDSVHDLHDVDGLSERTGSLEKLTPGSHRTSIFVEHHDVSPLPRVWGRESQSGYKGRRVLGLEDEKSSYMNDGPLGAYGPDSTRDAEPFPAYEMPQRYARHASYRPETPISLAGNNNTFAPPVTKRKRCGVGKRTFWLLVTLLCLFIIGCIVGGMVAGITSAASKDSTNNAVYVTSTDVSSATSSLTLDNGVVVLTTQVYTSLRILASTTATEQSSSTNTASSTITSTSSSTMAKSTSASISSRPATSTSTSTTSSTQAASSSTSSSTSQSTPGPGVLALACPLLNGNTVSTTVSNKPYSYTIFCNSDFRSSDLQTVNASSISECYNACAQYTSSQSGSNVCSGVTFHANLTSSETVGGNCYLKGDASSMYSTGVSNTIAAAVWNSGVQRRWLHGVLPIPWVQ